MWSFYFPHGNIYVQFDGIVYQQIVGIPMGTNCAPLIADLFLYCYERDFMSDLQKSKRFDLIDMFNDTSRYLDDIFTIDNPEFEKHISDIYPAELQLNKANTSDKENSFLDLNIKVIGSDIHTSVYDTRDDFGFPIVNFPWLSGDVPRLPSYGIYISQLVVLAFWISILKTSKLLQNCWHRVIDITSFEKHLESSLDHTLNFCWNLLIFRSKNNCPNLSPGLLRWSSLQTKEGQRHTEFLLVGFENSQTPSTTTIWPSDHREDYRSCAWPFYSLVRTFPKALHSD